MGDISDMNDLERFLRSAEGKVHLDEIRQMLLGRTINELVDQLSVQEFTEWAAYFQWKNEQQKGGGNG